MANKAAPNPNSEVGNEIEKTCREPIVGRARHSVRAAPAIRVCQFSPKSHPQPIADQGVLQMFLSNFGIRAKVQFYGVCPLSRGCPGGTTEISRWQAERSHRTTTTIPTRPGGAAELKYHRFPLCRIHAGMNPLDRIFERPWMDKVEPGKKLKDIRERSDWPRIFPENLGTAENPFRVSDFGFRVSGR